MRGARAIAPRERLRLRQFSDSQYGVISAILSDGDIVGNLCVLHGASSDFIAKVVAQPVADFVQIHDGRVFPKGRVRGVLFAAVRDLEVSK